MIVNFRTLLRGNIAKGFLLSLLLCCLGCSFNADHKEKIEQLRLAADLFGPQTKSLSKESSAAYWWELVEDPLLLSWINQLGQQNYQLLAATERINFSAAGVSRATAALLPQINAEYSASRSQQTIASFGAIGQQLSGGQEDGAVVNQKIFNNFYNLGLSTNWQLDLFGRLKDLRQSEKQNFLSTVVAREALYNSLVAELMRIRSNLSANKESIRTLRRIIKSRQNNLSLLERRYSSGAENSSALNVLLARERVKTARSELQPLRRTKQSLRNQLSLLLSSLESDPQRLARFKLKLESQEQLSQDFSLPGPEQFILSTPVAVIDQRPDLQTDEFRLLAARYNVDASIAALLPDLSFSGSYGYQALESTELIEPQSIVWQILGSLAQPIFAGGSLRATVRQNKARYQELEAQYLNTVLTALTEVRDALVAIKTNKRELRLLTDSARQIGLAKTIAWQRYERGLLSFSDYLDAEERADNLALQLISLRRSLNIAKTDLFLAMGGTWNFNQAAANSSADSRPKQQTIETTS